MKRLWKILGILLGTALLLNVVTEILNRKSFVGTVRFMIHAPMVFLLDTLLLLAPFLLVFFTRHKVFLAVVFLVIGFAAPFLHPDPDLLVQHHLLPHPPVFPLSSPVLLIPAV